MSVELQSVFHFRSGSGAYWTMVCQYGADGHCYRYRVKPHSVMELIDDAYFTQDWYFLRGSRMWVSRLVPLLRRNFQDALRAVAVNYLEWFEDIFLNHSKSTRKRYSYLGAIGGEGGRDLGNKVYSVVIAAAFQIRDRQGLRYLQCSSITSTQGRGDIVETLLGSVWQYEHMNETITNNLMCARTALEAACLGVEFLWNHMPGTWDLDTVVEAAIASPDFPVDVPAPTARGYELQHQAWRRHQALVDQRNCFRLALSNKFRGLVRHRISSYLCW